MPDKLALCAAEFDADPRVKMVVHSRRIGDYRKFTRPLVRGGAGDGETVFARRRRVYSESRRLRLWGPGYATVLHRSVFDIVAQLHNRIPEGFEPNGHDSWTSFIAALIGSTVFIPNVLAYYRQHGSNTLGARASQAPQARARVAHMVEPLRLQDVETKLRCAQVCADSAALVARIDRSAEVSARRWSQAAERQQARAALYRDPRLSHLFAAGPHYFWPRTWGGLGIRSFVRDTSIVLHAHGPSES